MSKLVIILTFSLLLIGCGEKSQNIDSVVNESTSTINPENVVIVKAEEMNCRGCVKKVQNALSEFPGLAKVDADLKTKEIKLEVSDKSLFNQEKAEALIEGAICNK